MMPDAIRLGVIAESGNLPRWVARSIDLAVRGDRSAGRATSQVEFAFLGLLPGAGDEPPSPAGFLGTLYGRLDRWRARNATEILQPLDPRQLPSSVSQNLTVHEQGGRLRLTDEACETLQSQRLDVILVADPRLSAPEVGRLARFGAAVFVFGENSSAGAAWDGFEEVAAGEGRVTVGLELHQGDSKPTRVIRSVTNAHPYSAAFTRINAATHAIPLLERLANSLVSGAPATTANPTSPGGSAPARPTLSSLTSIAWRHLDRVTIGQSGIDPWHLGFSWASAETTPAHPQFELSRYAPLKPPRGHFWADPFVLKNAGRYYVLFEELKYTEERGYIRAVELGRDGTVGSPQTVLDLPFHLSYPFVFEHEGTVYMLPEMSLEGRLELYRAVNAPYEWVLDRVLMQGVHLIDATLARIEGRWWMFACRYLEGLFEWNDLVLFHADSPFGPWTPHPANPVVSDVRFARPAGSVYCADGRWFRPAQDCTHTYGGGIRIQRIVRLTETEYEEEEFRRIDPEFERNGCHTINRVDNLSVIDLKVRKKR